MLIVKIDAGLGNQMLEYCFYRQLKDELKDCIVKADMDRWIYEKYAPHNGFELNSVFGINIDDVATTEEILACGGEYQRRKKSPWDVIRKMYYNDLRRMPDDKTVRIHQEDWFAFLEDHRKDIKDYNCWIDNAWNRIYEPAMGDFAYINEPKGRNKELADRMKECNSVSVHIRIDGTANSLKDEYFNKAICFMKERLADPVFFFFSNAPDRVKSKYDELNISGEVIDWNKGMDSHFDMQLMSTCRHNIVCHSSFSYWGAALNDNEDKIVIKPDILPDILVPGKGNWYSADNEGNNLRKIT